MATAVASSPGPALEKTVYNIYFPKISEFMDDDDYVVQDLDSRSTTFGKTKKWHFCKDIGGKSVPFDEGEMLLDLTYREYGVCMKAVAWHFERDPLNKFYETRK